LRRALSKVKRYQQIDDLETVCSVSKTKKRALRTESASHPSTSEKKQREKGGDPDNPSETTGRSESGSEDVGAK